MAIRNFTGFELSNDDVGNGSVGHQSTNFTSVTSPVYSGTRAVRCSCTTSATGFFQFSTEEDSVGRRTFTEITPLYMQFMFRYATKPSSGSEPIGYICGLEIALNSSCNLVAVNRTGFTTLATGTTVLSADTWYIIRARVTTTANGGNWEIQLAQAGGTPATEVSGSGQTWGVTLSSVALGKTQNVSSQTVDFYYDDLIVTDTEYLTNPNVEITRIPATDIQGAGTWSLTQMLIQINLV
jgi:hypothetical protein